MTHFDAVLYTKQILDRAYQKRSVHDLSKKDLEDYVITVAQKAFDLGLVKGQSHHS